MVKAVIRRHGDPQVVQHLWEAVTFIRNQRQVANQERILKYMTRQYGYSQSECKKEVAFAAQDGLLVKEISTGKKGSRAGLEQEAFWCVAELLEESNEKHDWYCFNCHKSGKVWCCSTCPRVYHPQCTTEKEDVVEGSTSWSCVICQLLEKQKKATHITKNVLSRLLNFVLERMKDKANELHKKIKLTSLSNYYNLVYRHADLRTIMEKVEKHKYRHIEDFEINSQDMVHTSAVYYGADSDRTNLCKLTLKDCTYDLAEIRICVDCYLSSNNKVGQNWFCRPCNPSHELAWVQMRGFGFWPAKILCKNDGKMDVRFFGKKHERALVPDQDVKDIKTSLKEMRIKQSKGWKDAHSEMLKHIKMVEKEKADNKRGIKRGYEASEAEEFVKKSHCDAGQVNSISTSQEHNHAENNPNKRSERGKGSSQTESKQEIDVDQEFPVFQDPEINKDTDHGPLSLPSHREQEKGTPPSNSGKQNKEKHSPNNKEDNSVKDGGAGEQSVPDIKPQDTDNSDMKADNNLNEQIVEDQTKGKDQAQCEIELEHVRKEDAKMLKERIEKAVEEGVGMVQKEWEKKLNMSEAKCSAEREESKAEAGMELEKLKKEHEKEITDLKEKYKEEISQTKKRQWCINCEQEAMYHCCWNTSYCSITCQQMHWHKEHKRLCRRKR